MGTDRFADVYARMQELKDLGGVIGVLSWDQETYMPPRGGDARAHHLATMQSLMHERLTAPELGDALASLDVAALAEPQRAMVRNLRWERDRAVKVPAALVRELAEEQSRSVEAWRVARERRDFSLFLPHLEKLVALKRQQADALGHSGERYDALFEGYEPGMTAARVAPLFERLRMRLVPLVQAIVGNGHLPRAAFIGHVDPAKQWDFTLRLLQDMGFDFEAGRQDRSTHPFTGGAGDPRDVRLTNRILPENFISGIMSAVHEGGHGLYEQGFDLNWARTSLAQAPSFGLHESQSRFWENIIGRSLPFWRHYLPSLQQIFDGELAGVSVDEFYASVNRVEPSLIRVEADEVTYNLHILLRFELELELMRGNLAVADLPQAWRARMKQYLGIEPGDDSEGVMQDIHWAWGEFGYFPTYTIGNLYSAMILERIQLDVPEFWDAIGRGDFKPVVGWLRNRIHRVGHLFSAEELMKRVTGKALTEQAFVEYLERKYGALYGVS